jgi:hypothetical protein
MSALTVLLSQTARTVTQRQLVVSVCLGSTYIKELVLTHALRDTTPREMCVSNDTRLAGNVMVHQTTTALPVCLAIY